MLSDMRLTPSRRRRGSRADEDGEEGEVDEREQTYVFRRMTGAAAAVFAEGDEAGERRDRRAQSAYIDGYQQAAVVRREMREQYRARHVAYDLAGRRADEQRRRAHERAQSAPDRWYCATDCPRTRRTRRTSAADRSRRAESTEVRG